MGVVNRIKKTFFPWQYTKEKLSTFGFEKMGNFQKDDVFMVGFPKSGNTVMQFLLAYLVGGLPKDASLSLINAVITEYYTNPYYFRLDERHFFKMHELPKKEFKKVIYIVRDGRDVMLSYYKMQSNLGSDISLKDFYLSGGDSFVGNWNNHVMKWKENPFNADILYIKFEDLISDKASVIKEIASFLNCNSYNIEDIVEATSIENMKIQESSFSWQRSKKTRTWKEGSSFVRKGKSGSYLSENVPAQFIEKFEELSMDALKAFNYV